MALKTTEVEAKGGRSRHRSLGLSDEQAQPDEVGWNSGQAFAAVSGVERERRDEVGALAQGTDEAGDVGGGRLAGLGLDGRDHGAPKRLLARQLGPSPVPYRP